MLQRVKIEESIIVKEHIKNQNQVSVKEEFPTQNSALIQSFFPVLNMNAQIQANNDVRMIDSSTYNFSNLNIVTQKQVIPPKKTDNKKKGRNNKRTKKGPSRSNFGESYINMGESIVDDIEECDDQAIYANISKRAKENEAPNLLNTKSLSTKGIMINQVCQEKAKMLRETLFTVVREPDSNDFFSTYSVSFQNGAQGLLRTCDGSRLKEGHTYYGKIEEYKCPSQLLSISKAYSIRSASEN
jgi:hypothetical protein